MKIKSLKSLLLPVLLTTFYMLLLSSSAQAGTIIKSPAYLGLQSGLVGCWNFDGSYIKVPDCSGNNNTGTITGATKILGKVGQAMSFDGVNDYLGVPQSAALDTIYNNGGGGMSLAFWIKPRTLSAGAQMMGLGTGSDTEWNISTNTDGRIFFAVTYDGATDLSARFNSQLAVDRWNYIVITWNGSPTAATDLKLYNNGVEQSFSTSTNGDGSPVDNPGENLFLGSDGGVTAFFNAVFDDIRIYQSVLTSTAVARLHRIGLGSTANRPTSALEKGLVGCWNFDGLYTKVPDCSGNNNTGTITGATKTIGQIGQALDFDGVDDEVGIGSDIIGTGADTISVWIKPDSLGEGSAGRIIDNGESSLYLSDSNTISFTSAATGAGSMVDTGLVTRYFLDEASSGTSPTEVLDGSGVGTAFNLALTYGTTLAYTEIATGRGLDSTTVNTEVRATKDIVASDKIDNFVPQTLTMEVVANIQNFHSNGLRIFGLHQANIGDVLMFRGTSATTWQFSWENTIMRTWDGADDTRTVYHFVVDTTQATANDRIKIYADGTLISPTVNANPTLNDTLSNAATALNIFNRFEGSAWARSPDGQIYYAALYDHAFTQEDVDTNYDILTLDDDTPVGATAVSGTNAFSFNDWTHVAVTRTAAGTANIYVNGVLSGSANQAGSTPAGGSSIRIGNNVAGTAAFNGSIDDTRVYNRVLSAAEISRLYTSTQSQFNSTNTDALKNGLVGHWTFDGPDISGFNAKDRSGNNYYGVLGAEQATLIPVKAIGKIGQALNFDGVNDYIVSGQDETVFRAMTAITVSTWLNPTRWRVHNSLECSSAACNEFIVAKSNSASQREFRLRRDSDTGGIIEFSLSSDGTNTVEASFPESLTPPGRWSHIVGTWDTATSTVRIYLNGVLKDESTLSASSLFSGTAQWTMGGPFDNEVDTKFNFMGRIDDPRIYNRALSAGEINKLYQMGR